MTSPWTQEFLQAKRSRGDQLADELVATAISQGQDGLKSVTELFSLMARNSSPVPEGLPSDFYQYFENTALPDWADLDKIELGERFFGTYGPEIVLLLFCKALPTTYSCSHGAHVLVETGRMTEQTLKEGEDFSVINRRLMETAQFLLNVMGPEGFKPDGNGLRTAQKIRLIHASIRYYLRQKGWDEEKYGVPINQEDLAGTLMSFSFLMIEGLEQLGFTITVEEQEAYLHCWKVIGHYLGIDEDLFPHDIQSAEALINKILEGQSASSIGGKVLTQSLISYMDHKMPFGIGRFIPPMLMREFIGQSLAQKLAVPHSSVFFRKIVVNCFGALFHFTEDVAGSSKLMAKLARRCSRSILQFMVSENNQFKATDFYIPPSLKGDWKL